MTQKEYFGFGSIKFLKNILKEEKPNKIFLVTGKTSFKKSGAEKIILQYLQNYNFIHFKTFSSIVLLNNVKKGILSFNKEKCDMVIAVGGGSVIDYAKLINIFACQNSKIVDNIKKNKVIKNACKPLVAIPTTSGSGSEATHFAVVYVDQKKFSVVSKYVLPKYSIIDPRFVESLSPILTAYSGMDALCQAIESYWSINSTFSSRIHSKEAINLILQNLVKCVKNPTKKTRLSMAKASNLSGKAINITKTTAPHAISYPLTYFFKIPHGQAVSLTLGEFFMFNRNVNKHNITYINKLNNYSKIFSDLLDILEVPDAISAKEKITKIMLDINLKTRLSMFKITVKDIPLILDNVNNERLRNNPRKISRRELELMLIELV